jgi:serine/threonine-protein kinase
MSNRVDWKETLGGAVSPGDVVEGKYRLERIIGIGGMGAVVEAWHVALEEPVAIKFLLPERGASKKARARFEREARASFKIRSEHVARVLDVGLLGETMPYMVMEYLRGRNLAQLLLKRGPFEASTAVGYVLQACEAVAEAHALGIVHRDLKPENLFLTYRADGSPCIKVLDFGLAKVSQHRGSLTTVNRGMGTPRYMSPEQWLSARDVGPTTDIWSFGVTLFELITGKPPFDSEDLKELCQMALSSPTPSLRLWKRGSSRKLEDVIKRCLQKNPRRRFKNIPELALALLEFAPAPRPKGGAGMSKKGRKKGEEPVDVPPPVSQWAMSLASQSGGDAPSATVIGKGPAKGPAKAPAPPPPEIEHTVQSKRPDVGPQHTVAGWPPSRGSEAPPSGRSADEGGKHRSVAPPPAASGPGSVPPGSVSPGSVSPGSVAPPAPTSVAPPPSEGAPDPRPSGAPPGSARPSTPPWHDPKRKADGRESTPPVAQDEAASERGRRRSRWLAVAALLLVGVVAVATQLPSSKPVTDGASAAKDFNPAPVDVAQAASADEAIETDVARAAPSVDQPSDHDPVELDPETDASATAEASASADAAASAEIDASASAAEEAPEPPPPPRRRVIRRRPPPPKTTAKPAPPPLPPPPRRPTRQRSEDDLWDLR